MFTHGPTNAQTPDQPVYYKLTFEPSAQVTIFFIRSRSVRDVMDVLVTCKYEEDLIKNEGTRVDTTFSPL